MKKLIMIFAILMAFCFTYPSISSAYDCSGHEHHYHGNDYYRGSHDYIDYRNHGYPHKPYNYGYHFDHPRRNYNHFKQGGYPYKSKFIFRPTIVISPFYY